MLDVVRHLWSGVHGEYTRDPVSFVRLVISFLGLGSLVLVWIQLRTGNTWNRLKSQHEMQVHLPKNELEAAIFAKLADLGSSRTTPITADVAQKLWADPTTYYQAKEFLNSFERFCSAVLCGSLDDEYAYETQRDRVIYVATIFKEFIRHVRKEYAELFPRNSIWTELEKLAEKWAKEVEKRKARADRREQFLSHFRPADGVKKKI